MQRSTSLRLAFVLLGLFAGSPSADAGPIAYTLTGSFDDVRNIAGNFVFDGITVSNWHITALAGDGDWSPMMTALLIAVRLTVLALHQGVRT